MIISPSLLSADLTQLTEQLKIIETTAATWIHIDIMDGHFAPNLSFGPDMVKTVKRKSILIRDVHLMVDNPELFADIFIDAGAEIVTFHVDALQDLERNRALIRHIHSRGVKAGVTVKRDQPIDTLSPYLELVDLALVVCCNVGFGGQSFTSDSLDKIEWLKNYREQHKLSYLIQVDGGINETVAQKCAEKGVDVLVSGSYIFRGDIKDNIARLCS